MPDNRSRTAVVDGPSAPAFSSITAAIACHASRAARASASSAANRARARGARLPLQVVQRDGTGLDALLPPFGIQRGELLRLLVLIEGYRRAVGPVEQRRSYTAAGSATRCRRDHSARSPARRASPCRSHPAAETAPSQYCSASPAMSCAPAVRPASHGCAPSPRSPRRRLPDPSWSPPASSAQARARCATAASGRRCSGVTGVLSAFRVTRLGPRIAQTVIRRRGGEILTNIDALRRVAWYRCQQSLEVEAIRQVRHSYASHLLDNGFRVTHSASAAEKGDRSRPWGITDGRDRSETTCWTAERRCAGAHWKRRRA